MSFDLENLVESPVGLLTIDDGLGSTHQLSLWSVFRRRVSNVAMYGIICKHWGEAVLQYSIVYPKEHSFLIFFRGRKV